MSSIIKFSFVGMYEYEYVCVCMQYGAAYVNVCICTNLPVFMLPQVFSSLNLPPYMRTRMQKYAAVLRMCFYLFFIRRESRSIFKWSGIFFARQRCLWCAALKITLNSECSRLLWWQFAQIADLCTRIDERQWFGTAVASTNAATRVHIASRLHLRMFAVRCHLKFIVTSHSIYSLRYTLRVVC